MPTNEESTKNARMAEPASIHNKEQEQMTTHRKKKAKEKFDEPTWVTWKDSKAKSLLAKDINKGAKGAFGS
jgi:hypothetical protein